MPNFVIIDFGRNYKGPKYFETPHGKESRDSWVPIVPVTINWSVPSSNSNEPYVDYSRTMLPIKLSHAWTIWKAQGQTIKEPILIELERTEREHGLTYTAFSRATKIKQIGLIGGVTYDRLTKFKETPKFINRVRADGDLEEREVQSMELKPYFEYDDNGINYDFDLNNT